jgi:hypothetical protein
MNQRQENRLTMFKAVAALFQNSSAIWTTVTPVAESFGTFQTLLGQIESTALKQQESQTSGYTSNKNQQKTALAEKAYALVLKLRAFAKRSNNQVLKSAIDISLSSLLQQPEQSLIGQCQIIHDKGKQHQTEAAAYNISDAELAALQALIDDFKPLAGFRDAVGDQLSVATDGLDSLFGQARETLDILDDEVEALISDSNFVSAYFEARKTTDRKARIAGETETPVV